MAVLFSRDRFRLFLNRLSERLWVKPLAVCLLSIIAVFSIKLTESTQLDQMVPVIAAASIETLLSIMAASMLVIATFSVSSMVSAYASASTTATPRAFSVIIADDASQNALSTFVGAFIFSIVALTAVKNDYFGTAGLFMLFLLTASVFALVIFMFVRWVDRIARLGRLGSTIEKIEDAAADALKRRRDTPTLCGTPVDDTQPRGQAVYAATVGYVQHIDIVSLQAWAEEATVRVEIAALPGTFAAPGRTLAYVSDSDDDEAKIDYKAVIESFKIGPERLFDDDPRFGLVALSEIAGRALSPAINDPGTAIVIIGTLVRLFTQWSKASADTDKQTPEYDRIAVPEIDVREMFDDAFTSLARDGAAVVEVAVRLQKALHSLSVAGDSKMRDAAEYHGQLALKRARNALDISEDLNAVEEAAQFAKPR